MSDFKILMNNENISGKTFLDIGFGQGLSLLNATTLGAKTVGCDINPKCKEVLELNKQKYPALKDTTIPVVVGSITEKETVERIKTYNNKFDIVHSWGVLHHTGKMWKSIDICSDLVNNNGELIISIYNKHWSSASWKLIKWFYNISPQFIRWFMIKIFYLIIMIAKFLVTMQNPLKKERGMNFYYDIIDWIGGYPYEYATLDEITDYICKKGYVLISKKKAQVPTGCNEFIFRRVES